MELKIQVPPLGESVVEGTIVKWLKNVGDDVALDEPLVELMTDKINVEIPCPAEGKLTKILAEPDTVVPVGETIALMEVAEGAVTEGKAFQVEAEDKHVPEKPDEQKSPEPDEAFEQVMEHQIRTGMKAPSEEVEEGIKAAKSSPLVRRMAREHHIDLRKLKGSGRNGRVTKEDVLKYIDQRHTVDIDKAFKWPKAEDFEIVPFAGIRKVIAEHMVQSAFNIPHVTTFDEVDMTEAVKWRKKYLPIIEEKYGLRPTFMPFLVKASVYALKDFPWVNSELIDDGKNLKIKKYYHIGFAVARENSLIVPVLKHADRKSFLEITRELTDLGKKANEDKLSMDEITGGTFSITNAGMYGAVNSTPIIAYPQVAILGVHAIKERPVVVDGEITIRPMMNLGLSFDHRVVDGAYAVQFLRRLIEHLEKPSMWMLNVV
jgi:2-oxoglutarate dehydrogenase E2 component (dihydrolipoamide succinyltransferase)